MQGETYKTITNSSEGIYKDKGSKFLAYAYPVSSEDEVKAYLEALRKEHHSARHHCWACKLGNKGEVYRCSDDGEPTNSAGKPILGQLEAFDVTNVAVVVVRYFGGVLLGVGGLIQAYKEGLTIKEWFNALRKLLPNRKYDRIPTLEGNSQLFNNVII